MNKKIAILLIALTGLVITNSVLNYRERSLALTGKTSVHVSSEHPSTEPSNSQAQPKTVTLTVKGLSLDFKP